MLAGNGQVLQHHITPPRLPPKHAALIWRQAESELSCRLALTSNVQHNCSVCFCSCCLLPVQGMHSSDQRCMLGQETGKDHGTVPELSSQRSLQLSMLLLCDLSVATCIACASACANNNCMLSLHELQCCILTKNEHSHLRTTAQAICLSVTQ
jgi:hypothetical protein